MCEVEEWRDKKERVEGGDRGQDEDGRGKDKSRQSKQEILQKRARKTEENRTPRKSSQCFKQTHTPCLEVNLEP